MVKMTESASYSLLDQSQKKKEEERPVISFPLLLFALSADIAKTTEALCEVLRIPGSIQRHESGEEGQKSNRPGLVSPINEVSSD